MEILKMYDNDHPLYLQRREDIAAYKRDNPYKCNVVGGVSNHQIRVLAIADMFDNQLTQIIHDRWNESIDNLMLAIDRMVPVADYLDEQEDPVTMLYEFPREYIGDLASAKRYLLTCDYEDFWLRRGREMQEAHGWETRAERRRERDELFKAFGYSVEASHE